MNSLIPTLAVLDGGAMVHMTLWLLGTVVCLLLVWWLGKFLFALFGGTDARILSAWSAIFVVLGVLLLINFILTLIGYPLVRFP